LNYREGGGPVTLLGEWTETCDGTLRSVDVDLTSLKGKSVEFILAVLANGSSSQDWAVWVNRKSQSLTMNKAPDEQVGRFFESGIMVAQ
jgi:hypothetical protein